MRLPQLVGRLAALTAMVTLVGLAPVDAGAESAPAEPADHPEAVSGEQPDDHDHDHDHGAAPHPGASRSEDVVRPIEFPVRGEVTFSDTWGAPRSGGRLHIGTDVMADHMQEVVAVTSGEIFWARYDGNNYLYLLGDDGWRYVYIHLNNDTPDVSPRDNAQCYGPSHCVEDPQWLFPLSIRDQIVDPNDSDKKSNPRLRVTRGQHLGWLGDSGNAAGIDHLHFEIHRPGSSFPDWTAYPGDPSTTAVNPYPSLVAAQDGRSGEGTIVLTGAFDDDPGDEILVYGPGSRPDARFEPVDGADRFVEAPANIVGTYEPLVGDFDGNGYDDILWYAPGSRQDYYWYHHAEGYDSVPTQIYGTYDPQVGDFDGNGYDDILWYAAGPANDYYWLHRDGPHDDVRTAIYGTYQPLVSDFDGNGFDDLLWYAAGSAADYYWLHRDGPHDNVRTAIHGSYTPFTGDLDGNGQSDIYWYARGSAPDYFWYHEPGSHTSVRADNPTDGRGGSGDFDADGDEELVWFTDHGFAPDRVWDHVDGDIVSSPASVE